MKNLSKYIELLGLSKRKELLTIILSGVGSAGITIGLYFFLFQSYILLILAGLMLVSLPLMLLSRYPLMYNALCKRRENEFSDIIGFYKIFLDNGYNTYRALQSVIPISSVWMQERLQSLLYDIDNDKSVEPYIKFARNFGDSTIEQLMISIYQITENGYKTSFFENFIHINRSLTIINRKHESEKFVSGLRSLTIYPLFAAGIMTVIITMGILQVVGGVINGL